MWPTNCGLPNLTYKMDNHHDSELRCSETSKSNAVILWVGTEAKRGCVTAQGQRSNTPEASGEKGAGHIRRSV